MGSFVVNFHAQASDRNQLADTLRQLELESAWMSGPHGGWITFWEAEASTQDGRRIMQLAEHASRALEAPVVAFLIHDSDFLCYWLYDNGVLQDEYNSCPGYWGEMGGEVDEQSLAADCALVAKYCLPDTDIHRLEETLAQWTQDQVAAGEMQSFVFAEERLARLVPLLGIREDLAATDFVDINRDVTVDEIEAVWIGTGDAPEVEERQTPLLLRSLPPLLEAIAANDIEQVEQLVADGADINEEPDGYSLTPLGWAATRAAPETVRRLIELGVEVNRKSGAGHTPLRMAVQRGDAEIIGVLLESGADARENHPEWGTLLHVAVLQLPVPLVALLLDHGADPKLTNADGKTPLTLLREQLDGLDNVRHALAGQMPLTFAEQLQRLEDMERLLAERMP